MILALQNGLWTKEGLEESSSLYFLENYKAVVCFRDLKGINSFPFLTLVRDARSIDEARAASMDIAELMQLAGCQQYIRELKDKDKIVKACLQFNIVERVRSCMERFLDGLSTLGALDVIREHSTVFRGLFCYDAKKVLQLSDVEPLFTQHLAPEGSNSRREQLTAISYWNDFLVDIEEKTSTVTFPQLLMFATGTDRRPPMGFDPPPQIEFLQADENARLPMANTCACTIKIPVIHAEYDTFKECLEFGILNAAGFGLP